MGDFLVAMLTLGLGMLASVRYSLLLVFSVDLSSPVSLFLNDEKAEERLKNAKIVLENRERAEEIRQRKIAIQRVDAQVKGVKKW